jgi:hypothetical protein
MTRGNPRPGQQRMPDRSDEVERLAHKDKAATTNASGEIRDNAATTRATGEIKDVAADQLLSEARDAARNSSKPRPRTPKRSPKAGK